MKKKHKSKLAMPTEEELFAASNEFMAQQGIKGIDYHDSRYVPTYQIIGEDHRVMEFHPGGLFKIYPPSFAPLLYDEQLNSFYQRTWGKAA